MLARATAASLAALLLAGCVPRQQGNIATVDIADAADDASNSITAYDRVTPLRSLPEGVPAVAEAGYRCTDGATFHARFDNRADTVTLRGRGVRATLAGQHPASGIWYAGAGGELRGKGRAATFTRPDGVAVRCMADR